MCLHFFKIKKIKSLFYIIIINLYKINPFLSIFNFLSIFSFVHERLKNKS